MDNTIYDYEPCRKSAEDALFEFIKSYSGISISSAKKLYNSARTNIKQRVNGASTHERILYIIEFLRIANLKSDPKFIIEALNRYWFSFFSRMKLAPGFNNFITEVRLRNIPVVLVTNLTSEIQYRKLLFLGIDGIFDTVITSQETNSEKDSGEPFKLLISNLGEAKKYNSVWFFGDSKGDFPLEFPTENSYYFLSPFALNKVDRNTIRFKNYFSVKLILKKSIEFTIQ